METLSWSLNLGGILLSVESQTSRWLSASMMSIKCYIKCQCPLITLSAHIIGRIIIVQKHSFYISFMVGPYYFGPKCISNNIHKNFLEQFHYSFNLSELSKSQRCDSENSTPPGIVSIALSVPSSDWKYCFSSDRICLCLWLM